MRIPSLLIAFTLLGSSAWAQYETSHDYFQIGMGLTISEDAEDVPGGSVSFDPGFSGSIAYGYDMYLSEHLSLAPEVELYYQYFTVDEDDLPQIPSAVDDDAKTFALMLNGTLDWHITSQFSWYGGLGVGWADVIEYEAWDSGNLTVEDNSGIAGQLRLGFDYNLGGTYDVRFGYRYFKTEPIDVEDTITGSTDEIDVAQHTFEFAFRWGL